MQQVSSLLIAVLAVLACQAVCMQGGDMSCYRRPNGRFAMGCSSRFLLCAQGRPSFGYCAPGFKFNPIVQKCVFKCGKPCGCKPRPTPPCTTPTTTTTPPTTTITTTQPTTTTTVLDPTTTRPCNPCEGLPNGYYSIGCSCVFLKCMNGHYMYYTCKPGFYFDEAHQKCAPKCEVPECGGTPTTTTVALLPTTTPIPTTTTPACEGTPLPPEYNPCHRYPNGIFGTVCASHYLICSNGQPKYEFCPPEYKFDDKLQMCAPECDIKECRAITVPVTTTTVPTTTTPALEPTTTESNPCRPHSNVIYGVECATYYIVCTDGYPKYNFCPFGYNFDRTQRKCAPKKAIKRCRYPLGKGKYVGAAY